MQKTCQKDTEINREKALLILIDRDYLNPTTYFSPNSSREFSSPLVLWLTQLLLRARGTKFDGFRLLLRLNLRTDPPQLLVNLALLKPITVNKEEVNHQQIQELNNNLNRNTVNEVPPRRSVPEEVWR